MLNTITAAIIASIFSVLITFFITSMAQKNAFGKIVKSYVDVHTKIYHASCPSNIDKLDRIEKALIFLVIKQGYTLKEAGLD